MSDATPSISGNALTTMVRKNASLLLLISYMALLAVLTWTYFFQDEGPLSSSHDRPTETAPSAVVVQSFYNSAVAAAYAAYALTTVAATIVEGEPALSRCFLTAGCSFLSCLGHFLAAAGFLPWLNKTVSPANGTHDVVSLLSRGYCSSAMLLVLFGTASSEQPSGARSSMMMMVRCLVANWSLLLLPGVFEAFELPGSALLSHCGSMPWLVGSLAIICSRLRALASSAETAALSDNDDAKRHLRLMALIGIFAAMVACSWTLSLCSSDRAVLTVMHQMGGVADVAYCLILLFGAQSTVVFMATVRKYSEIQEVSLRHRHALAALANMVRTPLSGIQALTKQSLSDSNNGSSFEDAMGLIHDTSHLLVRRVLDRANLQTLELDMRFGPVCISELLNEAVTLVRPLLQQNTELYMTDDGSQRDTLPILEGDCDRLAQMLHGLLGIAAKYTFNGFISVCARLDRKGNMRIEIKDTGEQHRSDVGDDDDSLLCPGHQITYPYSDAQSLLLCLCFEWCTVV